MVSDITELFLNTQVNIAGLRTACKNPTKHIRGPLIKNLSLPSLRIRPSALFRFRIKFYNHESFWVLDTLWGIGPKRDLTMETVHTPLNIDLLLPDYTAQYDDYDLQIRRR